MNIKGFATSLAAMAWLALAPFAASAAGAGPAVSHFTLANGLEVVVIPDRRTAVVTHMVWYKVGSADEPAGKSGIAHFLEHLMFKGTEKNPAGKFSQVVSAIGGQENAFTSQDYTGYFQRVTREHLRSLMEFEADRMTGLILTDDVVLPERNVILEERNQRIDNDPGAKLGEQIQAALYLNHPYGKPIIGWRQEMEGLNGEDALAFYRRFYTPNNAVLVVAGDVTADEVRALAEETYGKIPRQVETPVRKRPQEPVPNAARTVTLADARVAQPSVQRQYLVPSMVTAKPGEAEALDVLAQVLGGGSTSLLHRRLVVEKGIAVSAGAYYQGAALDPSRFTVYASPKPGVTLTQLEAALDEVLAEIAERPVDAADLDRAKSRMIADYVYALDNQAMLARLYGVALTTGSTVEDVQARPARIKAVTADAVREAARKWLRTERSVTGYLVKDAAAKGEKRS